MSNSFPQAVIDAAKASHAKWGIFASLSLAQWALESNYGLKMSGENNPFGIKAKSDIGARSCTTHEFIQGRYVRVVQFFKNFASVGDAFNEHARLLACSPYYKTAQHAKNPKDFAGDLTGTYATDPHYGAKLIAIMDGHNLYQYD